MPPRASRRPRLATLRRACPGGVTACGSRRPCRDAAVLARCGPAAAARAWLDGECNASRGPHALEGEMHGSPLHPAGSEGDEPVPGMISGGAPPPQPPPEMHDPALAAGRTRSPRRVTARLAAFRPLAFPAGPLTRFPAAGAAPPGAWPVARPDRPSVRRGSAGSTRDGCRGGTAASSRPALVGQARTARHQPPACEGITRRTASCAWLPDLPGHRGGPADRGVREAAAWQIRPSRPRPVPASSTAAARPPPPAARHDGQPKRGR